MMIEKALEHIEDLVESGMGLEYKFAADVYNKEHRTIQLRLPRQTGQSTSVIAAVKKYYINPLYVSNAESLRLFDLPKKNKLAYHQVTKNGDKHLRGRDFDCVIIDNASFAEEETKEILENKNLATISTTHKNFLFILIG